ncbi:Cohesin domain protein [Allorhodopirellula solitaria]|uniref:Cohesin domain protein n=2 Tax=Allorhodopirellula solitaria TaxID=2527987 RepID=A0A5C5XPY8_9BACT|nr:Cohesin domain protein [Allorhodopirellula solitaria]
MASVSMPNAPMPHPSDGQEVAAEVAAPISVTGADGLRAAEVRIQFDPSEVTTDASQISSGSIWNGKASVIARVDQEAGSIVVYVFAANPVPSGDGELIDIDFTVQPGASQRGPADIDVQRVRLNEGQISLTDEPRVGHDPSDGQILIEQGPGATPEPQPGRQSFSSQFVADPQSSHSVAWKSDFQASGVELAPSPEAEVYGPLRPQSIDNYFQQMHDSQSPSEQHFNVRAHWQF